MDPAHTFASAAQKDFVVESLGVTGAAVGIWSGWRRRRIRREGVAAVSLPAEYQSPTLIVSRFAIVPIRCTFAVLRFR
jgi:hypothetical protein